MVEVETAKATVEIEEPAKAQTFP
ncbi:hypothetical protein [Mesorhizobium sp. M1396]